MQVCQANAAKPPSKICRTIAYEPKGADIPTRANVGILKQAKEATPYTRTVITIRAHGHVYPKTEKTSVCTLVGLRVFDVVGLYE